MQSRTLNQSELPFWELYLINIILPMTERKTVDITVTARINTATVMVTVTDNSPKPYNNSPQGANG